MSTSELQLRYCTVCEAGIKPANEDAVAADIPLDPHLLTYKGACFSLADNILPGQNCRQCLRLNGCHGTVA